MNRLVRGLLNALETLTAILLLAVSVIVIAQVVLRYCFSASITGANETITILFIYMSTLGAAVAVGRGEHIAITMGTDAMKSEVQRVLRWLGIAAVGFVNAIMVFYSVGWIRITGHFLMPTTELARRVVQLSVPIGCSIATLLCLCLMLGFTPKKIETANTSQVSDSPGGEN